MNTHFNGRGKFILIPIAILAFVALGGWVVMLLWNAILPGLISGVEMLTFPKAIGLLVLCKILFGGFKGKSGGKPDFRRSIRMKEKMMTMTDEEKEKFKAEWRQRCGR